MTWGNNGTGPMGASPLINWPGNAGAVYSPFYDNSESILAVMSRGGISANIMAPNGASLLQAIAQGTPQNATNGIGLVAPAAAVNPTSATGSRTANILSSPFSLGSPPWGAQRLTVTNNSALDPLGTNTACTLLETATTGTHVLSLSAGFLPPALPASTFTLSAYFNPNLTRPGASLQMTSVPAGSAFAAFSLVGAGSVVFASGAAGVWSAAVATITPAANGFYYCTLTATASVVPSTAINIGICSDNFGSTNYTGVVTDGMTVWNAGLQAGSVQVPMQYAGN